MPPPAPPADAEVDVEAVFDAAIEDCIVAFDEDAEALPPLPRAAPPARPSREHEPAADTSAAGKTNATHTTKLSGPQRRIEFN